MPLSRQVLERQLRIAQEDLEHRVKSLNTAGKSGATLRTDPTWRTLNAQCNAVRRRLAAVAAVEANNAEVERRKSEQGSGEASEE